MKTVEGIAWGVADGIGRIILKRSEHANTLAHAASRALVRAIHEVLDCQPRVVVLTAEGRIFCAGGDINEFVAAGPALGTLVDEVLTPLHPALHRLATAPVPIVTAINGPVAGAGIGLALCGDFVLGAESMKLRTGYAADWPFLVEGPGTVYTPTTATAVGELMKPARTVRQRQGNSVWVLGLPRVGLLLRDLGPHVPEIGSDGIDLGVLLRFQNAAVGSSTEEQSA